MRPAEISARIHATASQNYFGVVIDTADGSESAHLSQDIRRLDQSRTETDTRR